MEDIVIDVFHEYKKKHPDFCPCKQCEMDVIALSLNKVKAKYVVSPMGQVFSNIMRNDRQLRADALIAVLDAVKIVSQKPNHNSGAQ